MTKRRARHARRPCWFVYMLECERDRIYTGVTTDPDARFKKHCSGRGAAFTRINKPVRLLASKKCRGRSDALKLEYKLKQLTRDQKLLWIAKACSLRARDKLSLRP